MPDNTCAWLEAGNPAPRKELVRDTILEMMDDLNWRPLRELVAGVGELVDEHAAAYAEKILYGMVAHGCVLKGDNGKRHYVTFALGWPHDGGPLPELEPSRKIHYDPPPKRRRSGPHKKQPRTPNPEVAARIRAEILLAVPAMPGGLSRHALETYVTGKAIAIRAATDDLIAEGVIELRRIGAYDRLHLATSPPTTTEGNTMTDKRVDIAELNDTVGSRLRRVRTALDLKSAEMATYLGVGASKYSNMETNKVAADDALLEAIDAILAVNGIPAGWVKGEPLQTLVVPLGPAGTELWDYDSESLLTEIGRRLATAVEFPAYGETEAYTTTLGVEQIPGQTAIEMPSVGSPAPLPAFPGVVIGAPVVAAVVSATDVAAVHDEVLALLGTPSAPAPESLFAQPALVDVPERSLLDVLLEQYGPNGTPPAAFMPAAPQPA